MKRIVVTGATGALGWFLVQQLSRGNLARSGEIVSVSRRAGPVPAGATQRADLLDPGQCAQLIDRLRPDALFLTAWQTTHTTYWTDPGNVTWADNSIAMIERFLDHGGKTVVFAGTCAEYGWDRTPLTEGENETPSTLYGQQKLRVSRFLQQAATPGMRLISARLFFPYSYRENPARVTSLVAKAASEGKDFHLGAGDVWRDMYPTEYAAQVMVRLAEDAPSGTYNIVRDQPIHLGRFLDRLARTIDPTVRVSWSDHTPDQGPRRLIGDPTRIRPFLPSFDPAQEIAEFASRFRS